MSGKPVAVVTGGAGFIGSHMVDLLLDFRTWPVEKPLNGQAHSGPTPARARTIILTTHQAHLAERLAETTLTMRAGTKMTSPGFNVKSRSTRPCSIIFLISTI